MFYKGTMEQNAQSNVPCKHGNFASFASRRNHLLGCIERVYGDCNTLHVDIYQHFSEMLWRHQWSQSILHNLPPILLKLFDPLRFFSKRIIHYQLYPKIVFSLQKHTSNTIKTFEATASI